MESGVALLRWPGRIPFRQQIGAAIAALPDFGVSSVVHGGEFESAVKTHPAGISARLPYRCDAEGTDDDENDPGSRTDTPQEAPDFANEVEQSVPVQVRTSFEVEHAAQGIGV